MKGCKICKLCGFSLISFIVLAVIGLSFSIIIKLSAPPILYTINLSEFSGRVLPAKEVQPGTFLIKRQFGEVKQWGKDAILTVEKLYDIDGVVLKAWRPDPITFGLFQYAEKDSVFSLPAYYGLKKIALEDKNLKILATVSKARLIALWTIMALFSMAGVYGSVWIIKKGHEAHTAS